MTAPYVPPRGGTRGRGWAEMFGEVARTPGGPVTPPVLRRDPTVSRALFADAGRRRTVLPAFGAVPVEYDPRLRFDYDCAQVVAIGLQGTVEPTRLGAPGARLVLAVWSDADADWIALDGTDGLMAAEPALPLDAPGLRHSGIAVLPDALRAAGSLLFGVFTRGGNGVLRPWVGNVAIDFYDHVPTGPTPLAVDDFEEYVPGSFTGGEDGAATALIRPGRWSRHGVTSLTGNVAESVAVWSGSRTYVAGFLPAELVSGDAYIERSEWGLPPDTAVRVVVRMYPSQFLGWDSTVAENYPKVGLEVNGARHAFRGFDDPPPPPVEWVTLEVHAVTASDGTLPVRLGHFDFVNTSGVRTALFDRVEIFADDADEAPDEDPIAFAGRDGYPGAPSGQVWQTDETGATAAIDTTEAEEGDVPAWAPDHFGPGNGGFAMRSPFPPRPADCATVNYQLMLINCEFVWVVASAVVFASGYGNNYGNDYGGPA